METVTADRVRIVLGTNPTRLLVYMDHIRIATLGDDEMITFHVSVDQSGIQLIQESRQPIRCVCRLSFRRRDLFRQLRISGSP